MPMREEKRLKKLRSYGILDTPAEEDFDRIAQLAAFASDTALALITFVDENRQWFKSAIGLPKDVTETPREFAFCAQALLTNEVMVIEDASLDERFKNNPLVIGEPYIRFYAGAPLITSDGFALGALCVIDTAPRKISLARKQALVTLASNVIHLLETRKHQSLSTLDLQQQDHLYYAEKMATLGQLTADVAHEVNNPLATLLVRLEMLRDLAPEQSSDVTSHAQKALTATEHISHIIAGLKSFSRDGRQDPLSEIDLNSTMTELSDLVGSKLRHDGIDLRITIELDDLKLKARPGPLLQILVNLVMNAGDAVRRLPEKWVVVRVSSTFETITVSVTDSGRGIAEDVSAKMMTPFFTTKPAGEGTGLGLSISKKLAEDMGAKLEFAKGCTNTTFVLKFKRSDQDRKVKVS